MQATDILTKLADESRLHYPWVRSLMSRSVYSILMGCSIVVSSLFVSGKQYRSTIAVPVYKHRITKTETSANIVVSEHLIEVMLSNKVVTSNTQVVNFHASENPNL